MASSLPSQAPATADRPPSPSRAAGHEGLWDFFFSAKTLVGALIAYYIALSIGLQRPYWSVITCYIVAQPLSGAMLSKAAFRLVGTFIGAAAAILLVPNLVNAPELLTLALALWLGFCTYLATLDRTPRAYAALLAGYTASIIGFPSVDVPGTIFNVAIVRVQEISIGLVCVSVVHALIFPRSVSDRLRKQLDQILKDAERWSGDALATPEEFDAQLRRDRRRLASDMHELHLLSVHLPYDMSAAVIRTNILRAMEAKLALLLPLASSVEDRMASIKRLGRYPSDLDALVEDVRAWLVDRKAGNSDTLVARARAMEPDLHGAPDWPTLLRLSLLDRMVQLIEAHAAARALRDLMVHGPRAVSAETRALVRSTRKRPLHRDHSVAFRAALSTITAILVTCTFWIATEWPDGANTTVTAAIICALFSNLDAPGGTARRVFIGTVCCTVVSAFCAFVVLPRATDFVTLALGIAPPLLMIGFLMARPALAPFGVGAAIAFPGLVGLNKYYDTTFDHFMNSAITQILGVLVAAVVLGSIRAVAAERTARRLRRASWLDLASKTGIRREPDTGAWISRMLDRIGLLTPYLSSLESQTGRIEHDLLTDMRTGIAVDDLHRVDDTADPRQRMLSGILLERVRRHFVAATRAGQLEQDPQLVRSLDWAIARTSAMDSSPAKRSLLLALVGLRCNLVLLA